MNNIDDINNISKILQDRIIQYDKIGSKNFIKLKNTNYNKKWNEAINHFKIRINKDRKKEKMPEVDFIVVRQALCHIKEIDDLRFFYKMCLDYQFKKKGNTFSKCFWGSLKIR